MLATAEQEYRDLQLQKKGRDVEGFLNDKEIDILLDVAVLRYLKRTNKLPNNVKEAFAQGTSLDRKKELAASWING
jgi:hypothetical protein